MTSKKERLLILEKTNGRCAYCGIKLEKRWHVDHIKPIQRNSHGLDHPERDCFENIIASCSSCNINKHSMNVDNFRLFIKNFIISLNRDSTQYKLAKRFGLIKETGIEVKFFAEDKLNIILDE